MTLCAHLDQQRTESGTSVCKIIKHFDFIFKVSFGQGTKKQEMQHFHGFCFSSKGFARRFLWKHVQNVPQSKQISGVHMYM